MTIDRVLEVAGEAGEVKVPKSLFFFRLIGVASSGEEFFMSNCRDFIFLSFGERDLLLIYLAYTSRSFFL